MTFRELATNPKILLISAIAKAVMYVMDRLFMLGFMATVFYAGLFTDLPTQTKFVWVTIVFLGIILMNRMDVAIDLLKEGRK